MTDTYFDPAIYPVPPYPDVTGLVEQAFIMFDPGCCGFYALDSLFKLYGNPEGLYYPSEPAPVTPDSRTYPSEGGPLFTGGVWLYRVSEPSSLLLTLLGLAALGGHFKTRRLPTRPRSKEPRAPEAIIPAAQ